MTADRGSAPLALERRAIEARLQSKIVELRLQPEFAWSDDRADEPVRVAVANCPLVFDLWKGLRNPATVGLFPLGLRELWEYYAAHRRRKTDETGRTTLFQVAEPFEQAAERFGRAVFISAMLPLPQSALASYGPLADEHGLAPWDGYAKAWSDLDRILDTAVGRLAFDLVGRERAVLVMNDETVRRASAEAVPLTHQETAHGAVKGGHYPQRSIAVLTGLGQFGVSRSVLRDEIVGGAAVRLIGPIRSLVVFDAATPRAADALVLTEEWREYLLRLTDFTLTDPGVNAARYCAFHPEPGEAGCSRCLAACPSGALPGSSPLRGGGYAEAVARQQQRFWNGALQFDAARCCDDRGQLARLYGEWMCGRCVVSCAAAGVQRPEAIARHEAAARRYAG